MRKAPLVLAGAVVIGVAALGVWYFTARSHPILFSSSPYVVELGDSFSTLDPVSSVFQGEKSDVSVSGSIDTKTPGEYVLTYTFHGVSQELSVLIQDTTAPDLEVHDVTTDAKQEVDAESFVTSVTDLSRVSLDILNPDDLTAGAGKFKIQIQAMDEYGNITTKTAVLERIDDTEEPVIEGETEPVSLETGQEYTPPVLSATDNFDKTVAVQTDLNGLDTSVPGQYSVRFYAQDRSGNMAERIQEVTVVQPEPEPVQESQPEPDKVVYLTFDDGPSENTWKILDILDQKDVKATFFVTGCSQANNDAIAATAARGHSIGLHTYTHDYASVYASEEAYFSDLQAISDMVASVTGQRTTLIRFPGGSSNMVSAQYSSGIMTRLSQEVLEKGYQYFDWNVSSGDAASVTVDAATIAANATSGQQDKIVLLMHDSAPKTTTAEALPAIIDHYQSEGYAFRGLDMNSTNAHHHINN